MRKIKFRGWLKQERKMVNIHLMSLSEGWIGYQIFYEKEKKGKFEFSDLENFELMQYTGVNDSLGTEIYEDDFIIEMSEDGDYYLKFVGFGCDDREYTSILKGFKITKEIQLNLYFDENKFQGKHAYLIEKYNLKIQKSICDEWIDYQVVGNIHQNPELLELFKE